MRQFTVRMQPHPLSIVTLDQLLRLSDPIIAILKEESGDIVVVPGKCLVGPGIVKESHVHLTASATRICRYESGFAMPRPSRTQLSTRPLSPCLRSQSKVRTFFRGHTDTGGPHPSDLSHLHSGPPYSQPGPTSGIRSRLSPRPLGAAEPDQGRELGSFGTLASDPRGSWRSQQLHRQMDCENPQFPSRHFPANSHMTASYPRSGPTGRGLGIVASEELVHDGSLVPDYHFQQDTYIGTYCSSLLSFPTW